MAPPSIPEPPNDPPDWGIFAQADQYLTVTSKNAIRVQRILGVLQPLAIVTLTVVALAVVAIGFGYLIGFTIGPEVDDLRRVISSGLASAAAVGFMLRAVLLRFGRLPKTDATSENLVKEFNTRFEELRKETDETRRDYTSLRNEVIQLRNTSVDVSQFSHRMDSMQQAVENLKDILEAH